MDVEIERAVRDAVAEAAKQSTRFGADRLEELGWTELLEADEESAVRTFLDEQGRLVLSSSVLDSVILTAVGDERWAWPATAFVYPMPGSSACGSGEGPIGGLVFNAEADRFLVPILAGGAIRFLVVGRDAVTLQRTEGIDPTLELATLTADAELLTAADVEAEQSAVALAAGRRALAHELIGLSTRMLEIVVNHVSVREQFNRPLGANQAVQHKLADAKVLLEAAAAIADEAWETPTPFAALAAKAQASRAFDLVAAHGQQLLGAIGYTWEHEWRRYVRRGFLLTVLLGAADELEREIGSTLVTSGVPRLGGLSGEVAS